MEIVTVALFILGIAMIVKGGDMFVDSASWIAEVSGIPKFIIGATIVSVATTMPEITVSIMAAAQGKADMAVGNAIGSVTANSGLIMGFALVFAPCGVDRMAFLKRAIILLLATVITVVSAFGGQIGVPMSIVLVALLLVYIYENIRVAKTDARAENRRGFEKKELLPNIIGFLIGAALIGVGAQMLVRYGSEIAAMAGVPERIIAVTFIAIGTALPELVTAITAIRKKHSSLSVGNIIGANIINMTLILPVGAVVTGKPLPISEMARYLDMPMCLAIVALGILPPLFIKKFTRVQGALLLTVYLGYVAALIFFV